MKDLLIAGAVALTMLGQQAGQSLQNGQAAQSSTANPSAQQNQAIPDAPRPQTLPIGPVTPGKGTTPTYSGSQEEADQPNVPSSLPTKAPSAADNVADNDAGPAPDQPLPGQGPLYTLKANANFVQVPFTVKDSKGRLVPGLTPRDVRVYENGLRQHMDFFTVDPFPLSVALVIDQSLDFRTMERVNNSLIALQAAFTPYDEVAVFTYNNGPKLQTTFTGGQSARLGAVLQQSKAPGREFNYNDSGEALSQGIKVNGDQQDHLTPLTAGGPGSPQGLSHQQTPRDVHTLNDAILAAGVALSKTAKGRRRIVYVVSDGKEYGSVAKQKDVIKYLETNDISVWGTLTGDSSVDGLGFLDRYHLPGFVKDNVLKAYTDATGGQTFAEFRTKGLETSFSRVTEQVRTQYTVGYYTQLQALDEKFRTLEVKVLQPNLQVIAKKGYYPTATAARPPSSSGGRTQIPVSQ